MSTRFVIYERVESLSHDLKWVFKNYYNSHNYGKTSSINIVIGNSIEKTGNLLEQNSLHPTNYFATFRNL